MNDDLISREALKKYKFTTQIANGVELEDIEVVPLGVIDNAPTVEPQKIVTIPPELIEKLASCVVDIVGSIDWEKAIEAYKTRPKGEWQLHGMIYYCSECGHECGESGDNFCGNCGADMRGGRE